MNTILNLLSFFLPFVLGIFFGRFVLRRRWPWGKYFSLKVEILGVRPRVQVTIEARSHAQVEAILTEFKLRLQEIMALEKAETESTLEPRTSNTEFGR